MFQSSGSSAGFRPAWWITPTFSLLGLWCLGMAVGMAFLLSDQIIAACFLSLPLSALGIWMWTCAWGVYKTRVVIDDQGVHLDIRWQGKWLLKQAPAHLRWDEIEGVTHESKTYAYYNGTPMSYDEYTIRSARGYYVLTKAACGHPERVARLIAERAGQAPHGRAAQAFEPLATPPAAKRRAILAVSAGIGLAIVMIIYWDTSPVRTVNQVAQWVGWGLFLGSVIYNLALLTRRVLRRRRGE